MEQAWTWVFRIVFIVFLMYCVRVMAQNARNLRLILEEALADRSAREQVLNDLKATAEDLATKTQRAVDASDQHLEQHIQTLAEKIDKNTEITTQAADASAKAAEVANSMNEKILKTNERVAEVAAEPKKD